jgi:hypothetical protein
MHIEPLGAEFKSETKTISGGFNKPTASPPEIMAKFDFQQPS